MSSLGTDDPRDEVRRKAHELGFERVGFASASQAIELEYARYEAFLDAGKHGCMEYLARHRQVRRRLDTEDILRGAKSIVCLADRYGTNAGPSAMADGGLPAMADGGPSAMADGGPSAMADGGPFAMADGGLPAGPNAPIGVVAHIARYARGRDYHTHLRKRLRELAAFVRELDPGTEARPMTDTAPVLERAWAARSGLGFIGKNGLLIVPGIGSYVLLGEIVTTFAFEPDAPLLGRCGDCHQCLDACPTRAFDAPYVLDPRRCVAYLTIELRGPMPVELREGVGQRLFGCDSCQEVCPFNQAPRPEPSEAYAPRPVWQETSMEALLDLDSQAFETCARGSPLRRAGLDGLVRNALTVLGNRRDPALRARLEHLARHHESATVREHAAWALQPLAEPVRSG